MLADGSGATWVLCRTDQLVVLGSLMLVLPLNSYTCKFLIYRRPMLPICCDLAVLDRAMAYGN